MRTNYGDASGETTDPREDTSMTFKLNLRLQGLQPTSHGLNLYFNFQPSPQLEIEI